MHLKNFWWLFSRNIFSQRPHKMKRKKTKHSKNLKKNMLWYKKKRIFCCFSLLQSYKNLNLKKKLFFFPFCFSSPGMFVSYFVQNRDKFNQIFWSHLELLKEDKHFVKKAPLPPAPPISYGPRPPPNLLIQSIALL